MWKRISMPFYCLHQRQRRALKFPSCTFCFSPTQCDRSTLQSFFVLPLHQIKRTMKQKFRNALKIALMLSNPSAFTSTPHRVHYVVLIIVYMNLYAVKLIFCLPFVRASATQRSPTTMGALKFIFISVSPPH